MKIGLLRMTLSVMVCAIGLLLPQVSNAKSSLKISQTLSKNETAKNNGSQDSFQRRQDDGFSLMNYFLNRSPQQQQVQQAAPSQQQLTIQQQHELQNQILLQQQQKQQEQLRQLQLQQLQQLQQPRLTDTGYQSNGVHQYQSQQQNTALNRDGGYGGVSIGNGYQAGGGTYAAPPKTIGISIGAGKPVVPVSNFLTLLPRIFNVLSAGGKVMFGVELGNNFYFGPVGVKPLAKLG